MVHMGDADGMISGYTLSYPETIKPALDIIGKDPKYGKVSGCYILSINNQSYFLADTTVNIDPTAEDLADIALQTANLVTYFDIQPRVALLSYSNFGSAKGNSSENAVKALDIVRKRMPGLMIDGEMQADTAVVPEIRDETFPFSDLKGRANVLVFPNLAAGNIAYKLLIRLGKAKPIGPILLGMQKPVHVLQRGCEISEILDMIAIAVVDAHKHQTA